MGVSGSGKSTIGIELSKALNIPYHDADDYHPQANVDKMSNDIPLNDEDRLPWLNILSTQISLWSKEEGAVLACSALKKTYRDILSSTENDIIWVYLEGSYELIESRLKNREDHFMGKTLLKSQFETLEPPKDAIVVSIEPTPESIVKTVLQNIKL